MDESSTTGVNTLGMAILALIFRARSPELKSTISPLIISVPTHLKGYG
jgi:hypothetical protein